MNNRITFTNWKRKLSCYKYSLLELLAIKINFFNDLLVKWRTPVFLKEIKMANLSSKDKVLHLGCGIFPTASIIIAEETRASVVGIDNNKIALKFAKKVIKRKKLSNFIKIEFGEGSNYDVGCFDVIFIAINVWPIDKVLEHLASQAKTNVRIICRGLEEDMQEMFTKGILSKLYSIKRKTSNPTTHSFLLYLK